MPWKRDENGSLVMDGENPVWIGADGKEGGYDPEARGRQIAELTAKAAKRKEELEAISARFASLEGVEDVAAFARQAKLDAETVASLKDKDRENEDVVRRRIDEAVKASTGPVIAERDKLKADYDKTAAQLAMEVIGGNFLRSPYVNEKLVNPAMAKELFAGRFALRDGALVAKNPDGSDMYGENGDIAAFDEAIKRMVMDSPFRDNLLKQSPGGSGARPGGSGFNAGQNPWDKGHWNVTEQCKIYTENPAQAEALAKQAGVPLRG